VKASRGGGGEVESLWRPPPPHCTGSQRQWRNSGNETSEDVKGVNGYDVLFLVTFARGIKLYFMYVPSTVKSNQRLRELVIPTSTIGSIHVALAASIAESGGVAGCTDGVLGAYGDQSVAVHRACTYCKPIQHHQPHDRNLQKKAFVRNITLSRIKAPTVLFFFSL
jgi:hypothetical protein